MATLSEATRKAIDKNLKKYPPDRRQSAVKYSLTLVQEENDGYLTQELMDAVADYLEIPRIAVYEVVTFYSMFEQQPVGQKIEVCTNISCMLRGSGEIMEHLEKRLGIKCGETSPDGKCTLREVECLGACCNAPMLLANKKYYEDLTPAKVDEMLVELGLGDA